MKLNLGCGSIRMKGWVNCDYVANEFNTMPDVVCDAKYLPFKNESCEEVWAIHLLEHLRRKTVTTILDEWIRVLKRQGRLIMEMPCLDKILINFSQNRPINYTLLGLYGDANSSNEMMEHKWCYSLKEISTIFTGYSVKIGEPQTHVNMFSGERDMRIEINKGV